MESQFQHIRVFRWKSSITTHSLLPFSAYCIARTGPTRSFQLELKRLAKSRSGPGAVPMTMPLMFGWHWCRFPAIKMRPIVWRRSV